MGAPPTPETRRPHLCNQAGPIRKYRNINGMAMIAPAGPSRQGWRHPLPGRHGDAAAWAENLTQRAGKLEEELRALAEQVRELAYDAADLAELLDRRGATS
jgi:hypothetical protein